MAPHHHTSTQPCRFRSRSTTAAGQVWLFAAIVEIIYYMGRVNAYGLQLSYLRMSLWLGTTRWFLTGSRCSSRCLRSVCAMPPSSSISSIEWWGTSAWALLSTSACRSCRAIRRAIHQCCGQSCGLWRARCWRRARGQSWRERVAKGYSENRFIRTPTGSSRLDVLSMSATNQQG